MAKKIALLIGVSEYGAGIPPLSSALNDVEAMERVLQNPNLGSFAQVERLLNPDSVAMRIAIQKLFRNAAKEDLLLFFFSGHGITNDNNHLYLATCNTAKEDFEATAVDANFIQTQSKNCYSKRQVLILDACYSGAFANGWHKKSVAVDIKKQLGAEGRVVLTSSSATQTSFAQEGATLSLYTQYLVEGIETGAADTDNDGNIHVQELHTYAKSKVQAVKPNMTPDIILDKEGYNILLAYAPRNPEVKYRKLVEQYAQNGELSEFAFLVLTPKRKNLGITDTKAEEIETEVLESFRKRFANLESYKQAFAKAVEQKYPLDEHTLKILKDYQQDVLELRDEDVASIKLEITSVEAEYQKQLQIQKQQELVEIQHTVECKVQNYGSLVRVENTLQMLPQDVRRYISAQSPNLQAWVESKLERIIKPLLLTKKYIDILDDFQKESQKIREAMDKEAVSIGYAVEHIVSLPKIEHLRLKENFEILDENQEFSTNIASIKVKVSTAVSAKFKNFNKIEDYMNSSSIQIVEEMRKTVNSITREVLRKIEPERFYMRFYVAETDIYVDKKSVEQELQDNIGAILKERFGVEVISVVSIPEQTEIIAYLQILMGIIGSFECTIIPLGGGESVNFKGDFQILGVAAGSWYRFQSVFQSMQQSQQQLRQKLKALKDQYSKLIQLGDIGDNLEELEYISNEIRSVESQTSGISEIKNSIEKSINSKLFNFDSESLRYTDIQLLYTMERYINEWARESVIDQYGLEISIRNLIRAC